MTFLDRLLEPPSYGYLRDGALYVPTRSELFREWRSRVNVFLTRKNWLAFTCWLASLALLVPMVIFLARYFRWNLMVAGFLYGMVFLGSYGTVWFHRFGTHRAFTFRNGFYRFIVRNLAIKIIPEEAYVLSHHVHHDRSEKPGDPYNVHGGWLYCFLADANHQGIRKDLSEREYEGACRLLKQTGMRTNSYAQYLRWGSVAHPVTTALHYALNWAFWYGIFFAVGGHPLATALFGWAGIWAVGVRTFNFDGHGGGVDKRREGSDFNRQDLSVNQIWPGFVAGEWHNNHHLYPHSVRNDFQSHQIDLPFYFISFYRAIGGVTWWRDDKESFVREHLEPYQRRKAAAEAKLAGVGEG